MKTKNKTGIWIAVIAVVVIIAATAVYLLVFKKKNISVTTTPQTQTTQNTTEQTEPVDMVKAFEGLSKEELQAAYDECVKHPEINQADFDCQVILNLLKYKK
ncbi:MAG: hypothetical protein PHU42_02800 [Patescibacteria group bacterium]|nr:hypothetical protein [Patescibacteria group bacterium]